MALCLGLGLFMGLAKRSCAPIGPDAATYLGHGAVAATTTLTTVTPALPASMLANDIIVLQGICLGSNTAFTTPTGYTLIAEFNVGAHRVAWWWKRHSGSESAQAVVNTGRTSTNLLAGQCSARRGCIASGTPYEGLDSILRDPASGLAIIGVPVTSTDGGRLAEQNIQRLSINTATTPTSPWVERMDQGTTGGGGCRFVVETTILSSASTAPAVELNASAGTYGAIGLAWLPVPLPL